MDKENYKKMSCILVQVIIFPEDGIVMIVMIVNCYSKRMAKYNIFKS